MTTTQKSIELTYFSTLVRRIPIREPLLHNIPYNNVQLSLYDSRYGLIWQDEPNGSSKRAQSSTTLRSLKYSSLLFQI